MAAGIRGVIRGGIFIDQPALQVSKQMQSQTEVDQVQFSSEEDVESNNLNGNPEHSEEEIKQLTETPEQSQSQA